MGAYVNGIWVYGDEVNGPFLDDVDLNTFKADVLAAVGTDLTARATAAAASAAASAAQAGASTAQFLAAGAVPASQKGQANGVAMLDSTGKVPSAQLPAVGTTDQIARDAADAAQAAANAALPADQKGALEGVAELSAGKLRSTRFPAATTTTFGAVKVGSGLAIDSSGVMTAGGGSGGTPYTLPDATPSTLGGVLARTRQERTAAGTYAVLATDEFVRTTSAATGTVNYTLPDAPVGSIAFANRKMDATTAAREVHITPSAGKTIEGETQLDLDTGDVVLTLLGTVWTASL